MVKVSKGLPVHWDDEAKQALKEIVQFIAKDSQAGALHVKKTLLKLSRTLGRFPNKFPQESLLNEIPGNYRSVAKWNWKIIYEVTHSEVVIVQVLDTRQDPSKLKSKIKD
ncbi:hypothetical protein BH09BAC1_BH09BAC1_10570 [soil metagenome]